MIMETEPETFTVSETAARTGLSEHTLRYYERAGLLPHIGRHGSGRHRRYSAQDLRALEFLKRLRSTGMPVSEMQRYVALFLAGDESLLERVEMLQRHRERVREQIAALEAHLAVIDYKIENYTRLGAERHWNPNGCPTSAASAGRTGLSSDRSGNRSGNGSENSSENGKDDSDE